MRDLRQILPSPQHIVGALLRPLPQQLVALPLSIAFDQMRSKHSGVFDRLAPLGESSFLIDPLDLPITFLMRPSGKHPLFRPGTERDRLRASATISGPIPVLIDLLEGRIDGDAMFFSRDLTIEGDTEAVLTLRNAIDSDEIDVFDDLIDLLGPFSSPARVVVRRVRQMIAADAAPLPVTG